MIINNNYQNNNLSKIDAYLDSALKRLEQYNKEAQEQETSQEYNK